MNVHKTYPLKDIHSKCRYCRYFKMNADIFALFISSHFNCIYIDEFPQIFKQADVIPVHKKKEKSDKTNYRPVSILPDLSKIYEKLMYRYFDEILLTESMWIPQRM